MDILLNKQYNLKLSYLLLKITLCLKTLVPRKVAQHIGVALLCCLESEPCNPELLQLYASVPQRTYSKTGGGDGRTRWRFPSQLTGSLQCSSRNRDPASTRRKARTCSWKLFSVIPCGMCAPTLTNTHMHAHTKQYFLNAVFIISFILVKRLSSLVIAGLIPFPLIDIRNSVTFSLFRLSLYYGNTHQFFNTDRTGAEEDRDSRVLAVSTEI